MTLQLETGVPTGHAESAVPTDWADLPDFARGAVRAASREAGVHYLNQWSQAALARIAADCAAFLAANPRPRTDPMKAGADFWRLRRKLNLADFPPLTAYVEDGAVRLRARH